MNLETIATVVANAIEENNKHLLQTVAELKGELAQQRELVSKMLDENKKALEAEAKRLGGLCNDLALETDSLRQELDKGLNDAEGIAKLQEFCEYIDKRLIAEEQKSIDLEAIADQVSARFEKRFSDHLIHHERRATETLAEAVKSIPAPKDALPVDSFDLELADDGRTLTVALKCGEQVVSKQVRVPTVLYRGVYKKGAEYDAQDSVTDGGCVWIAKCKTNKRPGDDNSDWQMAVKKGRDGIDLRENASTYDPSKPVKI